MRALSGVRFALLAALLAAAAVDALLVGGSALPLGHVVAALLHPRSGDDAATIVWSLRLPRVAAAAVVGASLAVAGALMQALLRNPLVDPYLTGVSSGAGVAIVIAILAGAAAPFVPVAGFIAGLATAVVVGALARRGAGLDPERLVLAGVSLSALLSAVIALALQQLSHGTASDAILAWLAGSLQGHGWSDIAAVMPETLTGFVLAAICVPALNVVRLGERRAAALGVDLARLQWTLLAAASLLAAAAVALAGLVGFVGLIVPHLARRVVGADLRLLVPAAMLLGATLVVAADAACRALLPPTEIPLGVLLAFIGVPAFLYLYVRGVTRVYG